MGRISIELVPRQRQLFIKELKLVKAYFSSVDTINIPDILRYEIRSLEGCKLAGSLFANVIPHLRALAVDKNQPLPFKDFLIQNNINEVLVILGDHRPKEVSRRFSPCNTIDLIRKFKLEIPEIKVYAGINQYRGSFEEEYRYIQRKIDAGADGFFTQPFFDLKLMELYSKRLAGIEIFWGASPVTSQKSKSYWENKNKVKFPVDFKPRLEWSRIFAQEALQFAKSTNSHIYFMPIKTNVLEYLKGII